MGKRLSFLVITLILSAQPLESQDFPFAARDAYRTLLRTVYCRLERFAGLLLPSKIPFQADGGGDGGGGDGSGGSGDGGSGDGGSGTGGGSEGGDSTGGDSSGGDSTSGDTNGAADAAAAAAAAPGAPAADPANTDPSQTNNDQTNNNTPDQTDPTVNNPDVVGPTPTTDPNTIALTPELAAIEAIPTTDPRGGFDSVTTTDTGALGPGGTIAPGGPGGEAPAAAPVDVYINAVIVSAAQSPWDAIKRTAGVRNVIVTGGIIALGKTPIPGEIPGGGPEPMWLRVIPDPRLLNGSVIPPVVPNIIDVRIVNCPIKVVENPGN